MRDLYDIRHILRVWAPLPLFWALFYQQNSTWVFQAQQLRREIGPIGAIPKFTIPPDFMPTFEDIGCVVLIFVFDRILYPWSERCGYPLLPLRKIGIGFFFIALSFGIAGVVQLMMNSSEQQISVLWQLPQIFCMSCAEITVAISGLDFAYTQSPVRSRNTVNAVWSLNSALGNVLVIVISLIEISNQAVVYFLYTGMMLAVLIIFGFLSQTYVYVELELAEQEEHEKDVIRPPFLETNSST